MSDESTNQKIKEMNNAAKKAIIALIWDYGKEDIIAWRRLQMKAIADDLVFAAGTEDEQVKRASMILNGICPNCGGPLTHHHSSDVIRIVCKNKCLGWHILKEIEK